MPLTFLTKPDCSLCDAAWFVVQKVACQSGLPVEKVDISAPGAERWSALYANDIPVVLLDGQEIVRHHVDERRLRKALADRK
jgi:hypothetical protein